MCVGVNASKEAAFPCRFGGMGINLKTQDEIPQLYEEARMVNQMLREALIIVKIPKHVSVPTKYEEKTRKIK